MKHRHHQKSRRKKANPPGNKDRGTIVVDSNMLEEMATLRPQHLSAPRDSPIATLTPNTNSYLDLLPLLAQQGYHIIIPETVMLESGDTLTRGQDLKDVFSGTHQKYPNEWKVREFLFNVVDGMYPNMEVVEANAQGTQNYQQYIGGLVQAFKKFDPELSDDVNRENIKNAVIDVQRSQRETKHDMGENHCFDVIDAEIARQRGASERRPVFLLTADKKARIALRGRVANIHQENDPPVGVLTSAGIYLGLEIDKCSVRNHETNALNQMGLPGDVGQHWEYIFNCNNKHDHKIPPTASRKDGYEDSPVTGYSTGTFPFEESARGIAAALVAKQGQAAPGPHAAAHPRLAPQDRIVHPQPPLRPEERNFRGNPDTDHPPSAGRQ